jgi:enoyl-CoA hydratase
MPLHEGLRMEADLVALAFQSEDAREGMRAFTEKRPPQFRDC